MLVEDEAVDENVLKRTLVGHLEGVEDHAGDPEEDDVAPGDEDVCWVEALEVFGVEVWPAHDFEWPEAGAEPGVEDVWILLKMGAAAFWTNGRILAGADDFAAVLAIPDWNAVAPPELTGNAPVLDVFEPAGVDLFKAFRHEANVAGFHSCEGWLGEGRHLDEPLLADARLDGGVAAVAMADGVGVVFFVVEVFGAAEILDDLLAAFKTVEAVVLASVFVHLAVLVDDDDVWQIVALPHFEVVDVVAWRDLDAAGTKFRAQRIRRR
mgnify:CR=1 FL=1